MDESTTSQLLNILNSADSLKALDRYVEEYLPAEKTATYQEYFEGILKQKGMDKSEVIRASGIQRNYAYQILGGIRNPSRDKVIALALAAGMDLRQAQKSLTLCGTGSLYSRSRRDAILIFCINRGLDVMQANELLVEMEEEPLN